MESVSPKAVFLSYAREDSVPAQRIAEALRSHGVELWFDQEELVGGDAWDAKIRGQIKECALFVPVISANTQVRLEGYFRLEWRLADQRTHLMAKGKPFLIPVTIDDVRAERAHVPDAFLDVQWTVVPEGSVPSGFPERIRRLLAEPERQHGGSGYLPEYSALAEIQSGQDRAAGGRRSGTKKPERRARHLLPAVVLALAGLATAVILVWHRHTVPPPATVAGSAPSSVNSPGDPSAQARRLAERAFQITRNLDFHRDDLVVAEDLARRATEIDSESPRAWGVRAWIEAAYIDRSWDTRPARQEAAQRFANRALALDPNEPEGLNALARVLIFQGAAAAAEPLARRSVASAPDDSRSRVTLASALRSSGRRDEAIQVLQDAVNRDPGNVLVRYILAGSYEDINPDGSGPINLAGAFEQWDAVARIHPFASAYVNQATAFACWKGDLAQMRVALDKLETMPLADRAEDKAVFIAAWGALVERRPEKVFPIVALTANTYLAIETIMGRPKAWLTALANREAGHANLAMTEWKDAELVLRQRLQDDPQRQDVYNGQLATTLAWLGRNAEASELIAPMRAADAEEMTFTRDFVLAQYFAALGDAASAAPYLKRVLNRSHATSWANLRLDPGWEKLRGAPEFEAVLAGNTMPGTKQ
jgi:tetratricopeptide (TPR) repeat protein